MVKAYIVTSILLLGYFTYVTMNGGEMISFGPSANRPTGPGGHYHK